MNPTNIESTSQPVSPVLLGASAITGSASTVSATPRSAPSRTNTIPGDFVGSLLERIAGWLSPAFVERSLDVSRNFGQWAILGGAGLTLIYSIFAAIHSNSFAAFMTGIGFIAALAVAQFSAIRFLTAATRTINNTPSQVSSPAFLECTGLLLLLASVGTLIGGLVTAIRMETITPFLPAVLFSATFMYVGATALHPKLVNVNLGVGSAGEEGIGLLSFFLKAGLKLVPLFFLLLAVGGDLAILASFIERGQPVANAIVSVLQFAPTAGLDVSAGFGGSAVVMVGALLPMIGYFLFLLGHLVIDLVRAVLCVPTKLDALKR